MRDGRQAVRLFNDVGVPIADDDTSNSARLTTASCTSRRTTMEASKFNARAKACERAMRDEIGPFQIWRIFLALAVTAAVIGVAYLTIAFIAELMK